MQKTKSKLSANKVLKQTSAPKLKLSFSKLAHQQRALEDIEEVFHEVYFSPPVSPLANPKLVNEHSREILAKNLTNIRSRNKITQGKVKYSAEPLELDILMETGTGKTFTFIETIYKLNSIHGLAKFIILVPSNAIKQGTLKNIEITGDFFIKEYGKSLTKFDYSEHGEYGFINNSNKNISALVMTFQSFNSMKNKINKKQSEINYNLHAKPQSTMEALAALNPVIIIDEPHRFTGEQTKKFLPLFKPQLILRFGATFRGEYNNLIHVLDGVRAFEKNLVKSIDVTGTHTTGDIKLELSYQGYSGTSKARLAKIKDINSNKIINLAIGENLGEKVKLPYLDDHILQKITKQTLIFANGHELMRDTTEDYSGLQEDKREAMLAETIKLHFEKEEQLFKQNIKALSLIFVDNRKKYMLDDGSPGDLAKLFEQLYLKQLKKVLGSKNLDPDYRKYLKRTATEPSKVHDGYFAISNKIKDEAAAVDLILNNKEALLSTDTDLRFVFSMWALQEGWDNPNIFTLCKLSPSNSAITKLQQIGRGLRLAVKQTPSGFQRITYDSVTATEFAAINTLDVIVPENEKDFVDSMQSELASSELAGLTNIISIEKLCELDISFGERSASRVLDVLAEHNQTEFINENTGESRIINNDGIDKVLVAAAERNIQVDGDKLTDLFVSGLNLDTKIRSKRQAGNQDITINKDHWPRFKILWDDIHRADRYKFSIDSAKLIKAIVNKINAELQITKIKVRMGRIESAQSKEYSDKGTKPSDLQLTGDYSLLSFNAFVKRIASNTHLSYNTIIKILKGINEKKYKMLAYDELRAVREISRICNEVIEEQMLENLEYIISDSPQSKTALTDDENKLLDAIKLSAMGRQLYETNAKDVVSKKSLTGNKFGIDSKFEGDLIDQARHEEIEVFAKLPEVRIPIPGGRHYNPDFAYVVIPKDSQKQKDEYAKFHLVIETKGYEDKNELRGTEKFKTDAAEKFFKALMDYQEKKHKESQVPMHYKVIFNRHTLTDVIEEFHREKI